MSWVNPSLLVATTAIIVIAAPVYAPLAMARALCRHRLFSCPHTQPVLLPINSVQSQSTSHEDSNGLLQADCKIHMAEEITPENQDCSVQKDKKVELGV